MSDVQHMIDVMDRVRDSAGWVDLTYTMEEGMPAWPTQARYGAILYESYNFGDAAIHSLISMSEHTGTHIDAPKHFVKGGCPVDELDLKTVMGRGVTIDAAELKQREPLSLEKIRRFEETWGEIRKGDIVMFRFGWDEKYGLMPVGAPFLRDWPGLGEEGARYLLEKGVKAVGCDTLSLDVFGSDANPCHHVLLEHGVPIIENICRLKELPVFSYVIGLPNKFKGGSGSPIRLVALT